MLMAAWHCGGNSSFINLLLGEPGRIPLCVGLPSAWVYVDGDLMFFLYVCSGPLLGTAADIT